ncbi:MAG TPA: hypothetical protein VJP59_01395 [Gemmatimonadota bacterium]|nr:hypothetical protein [Gemmatimonadota bacterium]
MLGVLAGCGGPSSSPEGAVQGFLDALAERDTARFEASFTAGTRELVAEIESLSSVAQGVQGAIGLEEWCKAFCGGTVEGSTLHGDSATVRVRVDGNVEEIPVVRVEDGWRIDFTSRLDEAVQILRLAVSGVAPPAETLAADTAEPARAQAAETPAADPTP